METTNIMTLDTYQMDRMFEVLSELHNNGNLYNRKIIAQFVFEKGHSLDVTYYDDTTGDAIEL